MGLIKKKKKKEAEGKCLYHQFINLVGSIKKKSAEGKCSEQNSRLISSKLPNPQFAYMAMVIELILPYKHFFGKKKKN